MNTKIILTKDPYDGSFRTHQVILKGAVVYEHRNFAKAMGEALRLQITHKADIEMRLPTRLFRGKYQVLKYKQRSIK